VRILIIPPSDYLGHPNPCRIHHIFEQFPAFGDEIYVMRFSLYDKIVRKSKATVISIGDTKFKSLAIYYLMNSGVFARSAMEIIRKYKINIVVSANLLPPYMLSKVAPQELTSVVDLVDHYPTVAAENTPKSFPKKLVGSMFEHIMRSVLRNSDSAIACSYLLADYAKQNGAEDVHRIPNGVEEYFFQDYKKEAIGIRGRYGIKDSDLVLCFVGNIEYWLNMKELLHALYLAKKSAKERIKLMLVGGKLTTSYFSIMENQIRALNLEGDVVQVGFVSHREVPKYIAASDIGVSPKNPQDPVSFYSSPVKVWEYLAQGKPVISTSIPETIRSANDCVSFANTSTEYLSYIKAYLKDASFFLKMAQRGRKLAREYTWTKIAKVYRTLLLDISGRKRVSCISAGI
jgi:glycosyltransferase involved in cell wall biosynthesis